MGETLAGEFKGAGFHPIEDRVVRTDAVLEIRHRQFSSSLSLGRNAFLESFKRALAPYSALHTVQLKLSDIQIVTQSPLTLKTVIRYNFWVKGRVSVASNALECGALPGRRIRKRTLALQAGSQKLKLRFGLCRRSLRKITPQVLANTDSYSAQLLRGVNYWRTVLDEACGIDVYGNNGIAAGDIDNDGFDDLYICQPSGLPNRLYRNRGDGTFADVTDAAGVGILDATPCALFADVLNRGRQDLLVVTVTEPMLFLNQGNGTFQLKANAFKFAQPPQGTFTGASFGDYDHDGKLDLYLCLYSYYEGLGEYRLSLTLL